MKKHILILVTFFLFCTSSFASKEKPADFYFKQLKAIEKLINFSKFEEANKKLDDLEVELLGTDYQGLKLRFYTSKVQLHLLKSDIREAEQNIEKAKQFKEKVVNPKKNLHLAYFHEILAEYYLDVSGDGNRGLLHRKKSLAIKYRVYPKEPFHDEVLKSRSLLLGAYYIASKFDEIRLLTEDNIKIYEAKEEIDTMYYAESVRYLGIYYYYRPKNENGDKNNNTMAHKNSLPYFEKSLNLYRTYLGESAVHVAKSYHSMGNCYHGTGKGQSYQKSIEYFKKVITTLSNLNKKHRIVGLEHYLIGNLFQQQSHVENRIQNLDSALWYQQKALNIYLNLKDNKYQLPPPPQGIITAPAFVAYSLGAKTGIFKILADLDSTKSAFYLEKILKHTERSREYVTYFEQQNINNKAGDQSSLSRYMQGASRYYLYATERLYEITGKDTHKEDAFRYANYTNKFVFNINKAKQKNSASYITDEILALNNKIGDLEKQEKRLTENGFIENLIAIVNLGEELLDLKEKKYVLEQENIQTYPFEASTFVNIKDLQKKMDKNTVLIDINYVPFWNVKEDKLNDHFVSFLLTKDTMIMKTKLMLFPSKDRYNLVNMIKNYKQNLLISNPLNEEDSLEVKEKAYQAYLDTAYFIYNELFDKPFGEFIEDKELIISTSAELDGFAWNTLLTHKANENLSYEKLPYFIKKHKFRLYNTVNDYVSELTEKESKKSVGVFGIAPFAEEPTEDEMKIRENEYLERKRGLRAADNDIIKQTGVELVKIRAISGGEYSFNETLEVNYVLNKVSKEGSILHIATHAKENEIYFSQSINIEKGKKNKTNDKYTCTSDDICRYDFSTVPLVVLSACRTSDGKQDQTEGNLSSAYYFSYAGAKAVLAGLWDLDDQTTQELMSNFYTHLKEGKNKNSALRQSQLKYLNPKYSYQDKSLYHPYFWSGFQLRGNNKSIILKKPD